MIKHLKTQPPLTLAAFALAGLFGSGFLAGDVGAASFDCAKSELTADEQAICKTPALNDMDVRMVTTFELVRDLLPMGSRSAIEERQIAWLAERNTCGGNFECLAQSYGKRMTELKAAVGELQRKQELP